MQPRFVSIWFRHLVTDWLERKHPEFKDAPLVTVTMHRGCKLVAATNAAAETEGIYCGMSLADARALKPDIEVLDDKPEFAEKLLDAIADWLNRYTPYISVDAPDGLMLDVAGCAHLLGGEFPFLKDLVTRLRAFGYDARAAMADTQGAAWAVARYGTHKPIVASGEQKTAIKALPPSALRLDPVIAEKLKKLGIRKIADIYVLPRATLTRRFGRELVLRLDQALGDVQELIDPKRPVEPYEERATYPEGLASLEGITEVLKRLLAKLCDRLNEDGKGIRSASYRCLRLDGNIQEISIGTSQPNRSSRHLFKLFENKIEKIEPALGIEVFILFAGQVESIEAAQDQFIEDRSGLNSEAVPELVDTLANRFGKKPIKRYLPQEHHWPERSIKATLSMTQEIATQWQPDKLRPIRILRRPEPIEAMSQVPDYPPMQFRYQGKLHRIRKADGPERIEREWWLDGGPPRDYFRVEDDDGHRYWLFRSGHYQHNQPSLWFLHGFFA